MVNRTKISKEISRAAGGASQISKTGEGTTLKQIQDDRHKWEVDPTRSSGRPGGTRYRLKKEYKEEQRKSEKNKTTPRVVKTIPTTKRVDKSPTPKKTDAGSKIRKSLASAVGRKGKGEAAAAKVFKRATEMAAATDRGKTARERLYSGARKGSDPQEVARTIAVRRERAPKTIEPLTGKVYEKPIGPPVPRYSTEARKSLRQLIDENEQEKERKRGEKFWLSREKTGGKVSRKKGGKISRKRQSKASWNGNKEVSQFYD